MIQSDINFERSIGGNKLDSILEGRRGWFAIFQVEETKKVTILLRLVKKNSFIGLKNMEAKEIVKVA
jgi:expansin (peptidoglycan-binding protein)